MSLVTMQEIIPGLFLGPSNVAKNFNYLQSHNIGAIVNCTREQDVPNYFGKSFKYYRIPIQDEVDSPLEKHIAPFLATMARFQKKKLNTLIHCDCGISRSASLVIAYLMKTLHVPYYIALEHVKSKRKWVKPNAGFEQTLKNYLFHPPILVPNSKYEICPGYDIESFHKMPEYGRFDYQWFIFKEYLIVIFIDKERVQSMYKVNSSKCEKITWEARDQFKLVAITKELNSNFFWVLCENRLAVIQKAILVGNKLLNVPDSETSLCLSGPVAKTYCPISNGKMWINQFSPTTIYFPNQDPIVFHTSDEVTFGQFYKNYAPVYWIREKKIYQAWIHDYASVLDLKKIFQLSEFDLSNMIFVQDEMFRHYFAIEHVDVFGVVFSTKAGCLYWVDFEKKHVQKFNGDWKGIEYIDAIDNRHGMQVWQKYAHSELAQSLCFPPGVFDIVFNYVAPELV